MKRKKEKQFNPLYSPIFLAALGIYFIVTSVFLYFKIDEAKTFAVPVVLYFTSGLAFSIIGSLLFVKRKKEIEESEKAMKDLEEEEGE